MTPAVGTAVAVHELALARVLAAGLARVHPGWRLTVLLLDGDAPVADEPFDVVGPDSLDAPELELLEALAVGPRDLGAALRPALLAMLAERSKGVAIWLDPTVRVLGSLEPLADVGTDGVGLVPLHPRPEAARGLAARGPFESGVVSIGDPVAARWWAELMGDRARLGGARFDPLAAEMLAAVVAAHEGVRVLRDPGLCVGWWTLAAGDRLGADGSAIDGSSASALNLAGFDPRRPHWLSNEEGAASVRVSERPELAALLAQHARELFAAGWEPAPRTWRFAELPGGVALDDDLRDLLAAAWRAGEVVESPFSERGSDAFLRWIDSECPLGGGVTWYLERVHRRRGDLQLAFPDLAGGDGPRLVEWMERHGPDEEPVLAELLSRRRAPRTAAAPAAVARAPVRLTGYLRDGLGLGEAARSYARALTAARVEIETVSLPAPMGAGKGDRDRFSQRYDVPWETAGPRLDPPDVEIVCMNPPELLRAHRAGAIASERRHRIGVWAWELDSLPPDWAEAFPLVDELWAYSEYVASALRPHVRVPVEVMPLAVDVPDLGKGDDEDPFTFLFVFDLLSSLQRKNPLGLIDAYRAAFDPGEGPRLLLKTSNGDNEPEQLERIRVAALDRPDIEVVDEFLSHEGRDALMARCDCYVSLHRAEGFGLTIAEAMAAARPVIATAFSGNLDFMTAATAYLVDWRPAEVEAGSAIYPPGARWAEPDLDHAAALMRRVYAGRLEAGVRGRLAREHVSATLSPAVVGEKLRRSVERAGRPAPAGIRATLTRRRQR